MAEYYAPCAKKRWCFSMYDNAGHHAFGFFPKAAVVSFLTVCCFSVTQIFFCEYPFHFFCHSFCMKLLSLNIVWSSCWLFRMLGSVIYVVLNQEGGLVSARRFYLLLNC